MIMQGERYAHLGHRGRAGAVRCDRTQLRNLAYSVDCCYDGQQALDLLDVETFDLVVLDSISPMSTA